MFTFLYRSHEGYFRESERKVKILVFMDFHHIRAVITSSCSSEHEQLKHQELFHLTFKKLGKPLKLYK